MHQLARDTQTQIMSCKSHVPVQHIQNTILMKLPALGLSGFLSGWNFRAFFRYAFVICKRVLVYISPKRNN